MENNTLSIRNIHERDKNIKFYELNHHYEIQTDLSSKYTSVTTFCHSHFPPFNTDLIIKNMMRGKNWNSTNKYWGMTAEEIKQSWKSSTNAGTLLHEQIEHFMNNYNRTINSTHKDLFDEYINTNNSISVEEEDDWSMFIHFINNNELLVPYRTEWMIYDEEIKISGSIDMVYLNPDDTLSIYDWKRCKDITIENKWNKYSTNPLLKGIPDTNYWHYTLQLNMYKYILESKYNKKVKDLYLVQIHPENPNKDYELINVPFLTNEINELRLERKYIISKII